ncbi:hypothetical protein FRC08_014450 [Ceratobasidium sp. 394]|nr:hypothetical protein FRC08_014450 [Ceratobasidium sp. 394]
MPPFRVPDPTRSPRLVLFIFYITEFRFMASNIARQIANTWYERGWECRCFAISLDDLAHEKPVEANLAEGLWPSRTFRVFTVYLTHAISTDFSLQTSTMDSQAVDVVLDMTRNTMMPVLEEAASADAALLCCGSLFSSSEQVVILQNFISGVHGFEHVVGFLNTKLTPSLLGSMLSWVVVDSLGLCSDFPTVVVQQWMRDEMASTHSDIIILSARSEPMVYRFAPFQSRPLGRDLPSILHACPCPPVFRGGKVVQKTWSVKHTIAWQSDPQDRRKGSGTFDSVELNRVQVTIACSRCDQAWLLDNKSMPGRLFTVGGLHCVQCPYFILS